ncbi:MAG: hypothetical protein PHO01_12610 [Desulfotomaculaceae bacterium]|nr:hypothetical protein [Desulfotomaculaceae bacterium]
MRATTIYEADDGYVRFQDENTLEWHWDNGYDGEGTEIIPFIDAADFFEGSGREDIAALIRQRKTCIYGKYGSF